MKTPVWIILSALVLVLSACTAGNAPGTVPGTSTDASVNTDAGTDPKISDTDGENTPEDAGSSTPENVWKTQGFGTLVTAPQGTVARSAEKPAWSQQAVASGEFLRPSGKRYTVLVYRKRSGETLRDWMNRSEVGNAFFPDRTAETANGHSGYLYQSNDYGALPDVHFTVPTENFVYYFHWENGLPQNAEEAMAIYRENRAAYLIPDDFVEFVRAIELQ